MTWPVEKENVESCPPIELGGPLAVRELGMLMPLLDRFKSLFVPDPRFEKFCSSSWYAVDPRARLFKLSSYGLWRVGVESAVLELAWDV